MSNQQSIKPCSCGAVRPYRRAYSCRECWGKLVPGFKAALAKKRATKHDGPGSLSLRAVL